MSSLNFERLLALGLLCGGVMVGCGDDDGSGDGAADGGTETTMGAADSTGADEPDTGNGPTSGGDPTGDGGSTDGVEPSTGDSTGGEVPVVDTIPSIVKALVEMERAGTDVADFPLAFAADAGSLRTIPQLQSQVMAAFLDPLTESTDPTAPVWGANNDFIGYLGDGWDANGGSPYFAGSGDAAWMWTNFEFMSNNQAANRPTVGVAPGALTSRMPLMLVTHLGLNGVEPFVLGAGEAYTDAAFWTEVEVSEYILWHRRMVGGALYRAERGATGWAIDTSGTDGTNTRFDGTSNTLLNITGLPDALLATTDDAGVALPANIVPGIVANCSGGISPWGTFFTAEENVDFAVGELETCWNGNLFVQDSPCDPDVSPTIDWFAEPLVANGDYTRDPTVTNTRAELYAYVVEIDPEAAPNQAYDPVTGNGHMKVGNMGRAHWENVTFHVGPDWNLVPNQPIVFYSGDDRNGGRIYKWVSAEPYTAGMSKADIRNLLVSGYTYVSHFADLDHVGADGGTTVGGQLPSAATPGNGQWILLATDNESQVAPNAAAIAPNTTVGEALRETGYNGMGAFDQQTLLLGLFSASNKIGVRELNRPEDLEWNAVQQNLWIAFTNNAGNTALNDAGVLNDPAAPVARADANGSIFVLEEADAANPAASLTFTYHAAWRAVAAGTADLFDSRRPDNIAIDSGGGVWFGTDGNYQAGLTQDAIYYLDVAADPAQSRAYRIATVPTDAETTGPMFASDELTLFMNVQHPNEGAGVTLESDFALFDPQDDGSGDPILPRSAQVALTLAP